MGFFSFLVPKAKRDHGAEVAKKHGLKRSPEWPKVEHAFRAANPSCACCGFVHEKQKGIQVHHRRPFHDCILAGRPDLEIDVRNLISLCENEKGVATNDCHILVGHLRDFTSYNPSVTEDSARTYHGWNKAAILADLGYLDKCKNRPKSYPDMTDEEKKAFRDTLDREFPKV